MAKFKIGAKVVVAASSFFKDFEGEVHLTDAGESLVWLYSMKRSFWFRNEELQPAAQQVVVTKFPAGVLAAFQLGDRVVHQDYPGWGEATVDTVLGGDRYIIKYDMGQSSFSTIQCDASKLHYPQPKPSQYSSIVDEWWSAASGLKATSEEQKAKWKAEGKCQQCGTLLPMSIFGLGECPDHPTPLPPDFKQ